MAELEKWVELEDETELESNLELDVATELDKGTELEVRLAVLEAQIELDPGTELDVTTELKERVEVMSIELVAEAKPLDEEHTTVLLTGRPTPGHHEAQSASLCGVTPHPRSQAWRH